MLKTPLYRNHVALGARMGAFAGYDMPLFYPDGVIREHEWTRGSAGLFDVSHMGQATVSGPAAQVAEFWERMTPSGFSGLAPGGAKYTVLTNERGGSIDDLIVTNLGGGRFFAVLNAGRKDADLDWLARNLSPGLTLEHHENRALLALQGPESQNTIRSVFNINLSDQDYMTAREVALDGIDGLVSRLGYTGEDGFEISVPGDRVKEIWDKILAHGAVRPIGLAARDSLRLEMGYPLYGHELDESTTPAEAGLAWIARRGVSFPAPARIRAGIRLLDKGVAREGAMLIDNTGATIGFLTSGGFSPTLKESIGMGFIAPTHAAPGTRIFAEVRGRPIPAAVAAMPFVAAKTKKKGKRT